MAAGLPIVASNLAGFAHVVSHGSEALLVRPRDERALADGLRALITDPDLRARMSTRGRERVKLFDWPRVAQDILSYYERLLYERESGVAGAEAEPRTASQRWRKRDIVRRALRVHR
jgi:phosphatidylinositol alpha-mannosyltransferase